MMKRTLCLLLALLAVTGLCAPAVAGGEPADKTAPVEEPAAAAGDLDGGTALASESAAPVKAAGAPAKPKIEKTSNTPAGVKVTWGASKGAAKYRVYTKTKDGGWKKAGTTSKTEYTVTGLKSGSKYTFAVQAVGKDGQTSAKSAEKSKTFIGQVQLKKAENKPTGVKLTWSKVGGAAKYRVFYKTGSGNWKKAGDTTETSYIWTKAKSGTKYTFAVQAVSKDGKTLYNSKSESLSKKYIGQVQLRKAENDAAGVKLTWSKVGGAAKYRVFYKTGSGDWKKAGDTAETSYIWTKAKSGTKYTFAVQAVSKDGKTLYNSKSESQKLQYIAAPAVKVVNTPSGMQATWNKVSGADRYQVYFRAKGSGDWNLLGDTKSTTYVWNDGVLGMSYAFMVRGTDPDTGAIGAYQSSGYLQYAVVTSASSTNT